MWKLKGLGKRWRAKAASGHAHEGDATESAISDAHAARPLPTHTGALPPFTRISSVNSSADAHSSDLKEHLSLTTEPRAPLFDDPEAPRTPASLNGHADETTITLPDSAALSIGRPASTGAGLWFFPAFDLSEAQHYLIGQPDGCFVVFEGPKKGHHTLCFRWRDETRSVPVVHNNEEGSVQLKDSALVFASLEQLVAFYSSSKYTPSNNEPLPCRICLPAPMHTSRQSPVQDWSVAEVCSWIEGSLRMTHIAYLCRINRINGEKLLKLDDEALKAMGVMKASQRNKLMDGICRAAAPEPSSSNEDQSGGEHPTEAPADDAASRESSLDAGEMLGNNRPVLPQSAQSPTHQRREPLENALQQGAQHAAPNFEPPGHGVGATDGAFRGMGVEDETLQTIPPPLETLDLVADAHTDFPNDVPGELNETGGPSWAPAPPPKHQPWQRTHSDAVAGLVAYSSDANATEPGLHHQATNIDPAHGAFKFLDRAAQTSSYFLGTSTSDRAMESLEDAPDGSFVIFSQEQDSQNLHMYFVRGEEFIHKTIQSRPDEGLTLVRGQVFSCLSDLVTFYCGDNPDLPHVLAMRGEDALRYAHLAQPWFHVCMSQTEASAIVQQGRPGTFVVRARFTDPPTFGLAFSDIEGQARHRLIEEDGDGIVHLRKSERSFSSLSELVEFYTSASDQDLGIRLVLQQGPRAVVAGRISSPKRAAATSSELETAAAAAAAAAASAAYSKQSVLPKSPRHQRPGQSGLRSQSSQEPVKSRAQGLPSHTPLSSTGRTAGSSRKNTTDSARGSSSNLRSATSSAGGSAPNILESLGMATNVPDAEEAQLERLSRIGHSDPDIVSLAADKHQHHTSRPGSVDLGAAAAEFQPSSKRVIAASVGNRQRHPSGFRTEQRERLKDPQVSAASKSPVPAKSSKVISPTRGQAVHQSKPQSMLRREYLQEGFQPRLCAFAWCQVGVHPTRALEALETATDEGAFVIRTASWERKSSARSSPQASQLILTYLHRGLKVDEIIHIIPASSTSPESVAPHHFLESSPQLRFSSLEALVAHHCETRGSLGCRLARTVRDASGVRVLPPLASDLSWCRILMPKRPAVRLLSGTAPDGAFVIRSSESNPYNYVLSYIANRRIHNELIRVEPGTEARQPAVYLDAFRNLLFPTLQDLVVHFQQPRPEMLVTLKPPELWLTPRQTRTFPQQRSGSSSQGGKSGPGAPAHQQHVNSQASAPGSWERSHVPAFGSAFPTNSTTRRSRISPTLDSAASGAPAAGSRGSRLVDSGPHVAFQRSAPYLRSEESRDQWHQEPRAPPRDASPRRHSIWLAASEISRPPASRHWPETESRSSRVQEPFHQDLSSQHRFSQPYPAHHRHSSPAYFVAAQPPWDQSQRRTEQYLRFSAPAQPFTRNVSADYEPGPFEQQRRSLHVLPGNTFFRSAPSASNRIPPDFPHLQNPHGSRYVDYSAKAAPWCKLTWAPEQALASIDSWNGSFVVRRSREYLATLSLRFNGAIFNFHVEATPGGVHLKKSDMFHSSLSDLVHYYRQSNHDLPCGLAVWY